MQSRAASAHRIADSLYGIILPYDTFVQLLLKVQQLVLLALHHPCHGNARPAAHHLGDVVRRNLLAHHLASTLRIDLRLHLADVVLQFFQLTVAYLRHLAIVTLALRLVGLKAQTLHLLLVLLYLIDEVLLLHPLGAQLQLLVLQHRDGLVQLRELLFVVLTFYGLTLYLQLFQVTLQLVQLLWHGVALHAQLRGSLIHEVYRLIRQETVGDIPLGECHRRNAGIVLYAHTVVVLVTFLQTS